jgi:hypothetical protein
MTMEVEEMNIGKNKRFSFPKCSRYENWAVTASLTDLPVATPSQV